MRNPMTQWHCSASQNGSLVSESECSESRASSGSEDRPTQCHGSESATATRLHQTHNFGGYRDYPRSAAVAAMISRGRTTLPNPSPTQLHDNAGAVKSRAAA